MRLVISSGIVQVVEPSVVVKEDERCCAEGLTYGDSEKEALRRGDQLERNATTHGCVGEGTCLETQVAEVIKNKSESRNYR